ncbi:Two-component response regulator SSK1p [Purpureocillium takamizusanense]|uniref:Two-component response regulator SSK1p n=1 Tax=Purpureocillium takamizusanense TaxID=2060973 RepID=A0A9Q8QNA9_9HYPO|nr:Two-component response regulator SSK1p [Purpureocillium takamizusanense]UNI22301.1 Two-component response regulator SSK1p [Purpureocillium takamizusanense]
MMASDIASRIRARLSRRRHSATASLASSTRSSALLAADDAAAAAAAAPRREHSSMSRASARDAPTLHTQGSSGFFVVMPVPTVDEGHGHGVGDGDGEDEGEGEGEGECAGEAPPGSAKTTVPGAHRSLQGPHPPPAQHHHLHHHHQSRTTHQQLEQLSNEDPQRPKNQPPPRPENPQLESSQLPPPGPSPSTPPPPSLSSSTSHSPSTTNGTAANPHHLTPVSPPPPPSSNPLATSSALRSIHEYSIPRSVTTDDSDSQPRHGHDRDHDQLSVDSYSAAAPASALGGLPPATRAPIPVPAADGSDAPRRQSLFASRQTALIRTLLQGSGATNNGDAAAGDSLHRPSIDVNMVTRKIWVKRPNASATTITINEEDLVDDVRDMILRKYANSLGRTFDSPDLNIRIYPRDQDKERLLGPEELMARTLDRYFPGGQTVDEALVIDIPRRTPKPSPRAPPAPGTTTYYVTDDGRPSEAGEGYFPPVTASVPSPHLAHAVPVPTNGAVTHSIAVLGTGHIPPIPSPGSTRPRVHRDHRSERPRLVRQHTASPTVVGGHPAATPPVPSHDHPPLPTVKSSMPKSPGPAPEPTPARVATPPPRIASPRSSSARPKKVKKATEYATMPTSATSKLLNGSVPPINVLIVEDNPINLKLLEAFVKRLKVRWQTAMNGRDAVTKWRAGGFHLVLMDIQLPVMNGLDATREIRRLERVNSIGVFSSTPGGPPDEATGGTHEIKDQDRLENLTMFKSPVIIVALTASSLQSDRHEALAAGCNDFLTKPVNFVWLERKVMEWGCMQALIDFDGWRKWKDYSQQAEASEASKKAMEKAKAKAKKNRASVSSST